MWVAQGKFLLNLRHAVELVLEGRNIRIGFVDRTEGALKFGSEEEAQRFFKVLTLRLGRLDGVLVAQEVEHAGQD
jgi:hypothetical protein